jgi:nucleotide-binding universal stress UspA family protein
MREFEHSAERVIYVIRPARLRSERESIITSWVVDRGAIGEESVAGADELDSDMIVLGAHGLGDAVANLGSASDQVRHHARQPYSSLRRCRCGCRGRPSTRSGHPPRCGLG